jgi:c-di-GMP-binding flagellar brake protein YcgR
MTAERPESERREFVRIRVDIPVRYKFLSKTVGVSEDVYEGTTGDMGGGGLLLVGKIPDASLYVPLLQQKVVVGINLLLPASEQPVKALCRVAWLEASESPLRVPMGLKFKEISRDSLDEIFRYVIKAQLK